jgi:hypothetical protein
MQVRYGSSIINPENYSEGKEHVQLVLCFGSDDRDRALSDDGCKRTRGGERPERERLECKRPEREWSQRERHRKVCRVELEGDCLAGWAGPADQVIQK